MSQPKNVIRVYPFSYNKILGGQRKIDIHLCMLLELVMISNMSILKQAHQSFEKLKVSHYLKILIP